MRAYIHDYLIDYLSGPVTGDVYCGLELYYSFRSEMDNDEWPLPRLSIEAGTPSGMARYFKSVFEKKIYKPPFRLPCCIILEDFDVGQLLQYLREFVGTIHARDEKELMIKLSMHFSLDEDYFRTDDLIRHLLYEKYKK